MEFSYVRDHYGVPACRGRLVMVNGEPGIIAKDLGHHIGVNFDADRPGLIKPCHPTWKVVYGEMGSVRPMTRAQRRYQAYLDSELSLSFGDYLKGRFYQPSLRENSSCPSMP